MGSPKDEVRWLFGLSPRMWGFVSGFAVIATGVLMLAFGSSGQTIALGVCFVVGGAIFVGAGIFRYFRPILPSVDPQPRNLDFLKDEDSRGHRPDA